MVARGESISTPLHGRPRRDARHRRGNHQLADDPYPPEAFHRGDYHRLRAGPYRVVYVVEGKIITIERVDRIPATRH
jgi:mRNA-degrading endonuclease RelE of RelBE toxin-antitoxin system